MLAEGRDGTALGATLQLQHPQQQRLGGQIAHGSAQALFRPKGVDQPVGQGLGVIQADGAGGDPLAQFQTEFPTLAHGRRSLPARRRTQAALLA